MTLEKVLRCYHVSGGYLETDTVSGVTVAYISIFLPFYCLGGEEKHFVTHTVRKQKFTSWQYVV